MRSPVPVPVLMSGTAAAPAAGGVIRTPVTRRRVELIAVAAVMAALVPVALARTGASPAALWAGASDAWSLAQRMWPPDFSESARYARALVETVFMAVAGTTLAVALSVPLAALAARTTTTGVLTNRVARAVVVFCRATPDIVFALLFIRLLGVGALPGVLAIGLHSIGMLGKLYADAIEDADPDPVEAVRSTGAGRLQVLSGGVLPQVAPGWISLALYRLDINVRTSVILGYVGAGGIGFELNRAQGQLVYPRVLAVVCFVAALVIVVERLSAVVRAALVADAAGRWRWLARLAQALAGRREGRVTPPWTPQRARVWSLGTLGAGLVAASLARLEVSPARMRQGWEQLGVFVANTFPPDVATNAGEMLTKLGETFWIAVAATALGLALAAPFGLLGARNVAPGRGTYLAARAGTVTARAVPDLVLAVLFVAALGLGPFPGVLALAVGVIGNTGKLMADALEGIGGGPLEALDATGASWAQRTAAAVIPQGTPGIVGVSLYQFDINVRSATALGIVGAGGIGGILQSTISTLAYDRTLAIVLEIFLIVYAVERLSDWIRRRVR